MKGMIRGISLLVILFLLTGVRAGAMSLSLEGPWKIHTVDDPLYRSASYDDSSWGNIVLPGTFMPYIIAGKTGLDGIIWLRKKIELPRGSNDRDLGLILGRIANADETYFNGEKIGATGQFPPGEHSMWNHPRHYLVPRSLVRNGTNVIAVRVSYNTYGEILGTLSLTDIQTWSKSRDMDYFFRIVFSYIIIAMGVPLFFIALFHFLSNRESQEYLYYCLQLLCGLVIIVDHSTYWNLYGSILNRFKTLGFAWVALNVTHPIFLHRIYGLVRKRTEKLLWLYLFVVLFIGLLITDYSTLRVHGLLLIVVTTGIGFYNASCHVYALVTGRPLAVLFGFFGLMVIFGAIHDGVVYFFKFAFMPAPLYFQNMIFYYTSFTLYLGTALVIVVRHVTIRDDMERVQSRLERQLAEYARYNENSSGSAPAPKPVFQLNRDKAEEKIARVLEYIEDNYTETLSREGIAAMVDIHPDNLGRMFKIVTGKKMGDYINELRIQESVERITGSDDNIIHIAFSVGFDSLRTFNRVFLKVMNTTPETYRKMHRIANHPFITLQKG